MKSIYAALILVFVGLSLPVYGNEGESKKPSALEEYRAQNPTCEVLMSGLDESGLSGETKIAMHKLLELTETHKVSTWQRALSWLRFDAHSKDPIFAAVTRQVYDPRVGHNRPQTIVLMGQPNLLSSAANEKGLELINTFNRVATTGISPITAQERKDHFKSDEFEIEGKKVGYLRKVWIAFKDKAKIRLLRRLISSGFGGIKVWVSHKVPFLDNYEKPFQIRMSRMENDVRPPEKTEYLEDDYESRVSEEMDHVGGDIRLLSWSIGGALGILDVVNDPGVYGQIFINPVTLVSAGILLGSISLGTVVMDKFKWGNDANSWLKPFRALFGHEPVERDSAVIYRTAHVARVLESELFKTTEAEIELTVESEDWDVADEEAAEEQKKKMRKEIFPGAAEDSFSPLLVVLDRSYLPGLLYQLTENNVTGDVKRQRNTMLVDEPGNFRQINLFVSEEALEAAE